MELIVRGLRNQWQDAHKKAQYFHHELKKTISIQLSTSGFVRKQYISEMYRIKFYLCEQVQNQLTGFMNIWWLLHSKAQSLNMLPVAIDFIFLE